MRLSTTDAKQQLWFGEASTTGPHIHVPHARDSQTIQTGPGERTRIHTRQKESKRSGGSAMNIPQPANCCLHIHSHYIALRSIFRNIQILSPNIKSNVNKYEAAWTTKSSFKAITWD